MAKLKILREHSELSVSEWLSVVEYYAKGHTARECSSKFGIVHKQAFITALAREHSKGLSHGGARKGSGNFSEHPDVRKVRNALYDAQSVSSLTFLPDPESVNSENVDEKRVETRNKINSTIAALKKIAALLGCVAILYIFFA